MRFNSIFLRKKKMGTKTELEDNIVLLVNGDGG